MEPTLRLKQAIKDYRDGKQEAFSIMYEESHKYVYTCVYKVMNGNDNAQDIICDIMQDTYVEISKYIKDLENDDKFLSWAGTIATRKCYAYISKNKKYVLLNEEDNTFDTLSDSDSIIPEEVMQNKEKQRLLKEIIDTQLTEMQKLCIIAYYYNEQKQSEIAKELGIPENTVKTNLSRAKAKIKDGVLDLEKNKGTKLYSAAPLLILLFTEDVYAAFVPETVTSSVFNSLSSAGITVNNWTGNMANMIPETATGTGSSAVASAGTKGIIGKIVSASTKAKIIGGAVAIGVLGAIAGAVVVATWSGEESQTTSTYNQSENNDFWEDIELSKQTEAKEEIKTKEPETEEPEIDDDTLQMQEIEFSKEEKIRYGILAKYMSDTTWLTEDLTDTVINCDDRVIEFMSMLCNAKAEYNGLYYEQYMPEYEINDIGRMVFKKQTLQEYAKNTFNTNLTYISNTWFMEQNGKLVLNTADGGGYVTKCEITKGIKMPDDGDVYDITFADYIIYGTYMRGQYESIDSTEPTYTEVYSFEMEIEESDDSPFGAVPGFIKYEGNVSAKLEDSQYENILEMVKAAEISNISHWQMMEDFEIRPEDMTILAKMNYAAQGYRFGWSDYDNAKVAIEDVAKLFNQVTGSTFTREEIDEYFEEMQNGSYIYKGTKYEDGKVNLFTRIDAFYGNNLINEYEINEGEYTYGDKALYYSSNGDSSVHMEDVIVYGDNIIVYGVSDAQDVPFAVYLFEDEKSPTGYRLDYIHYFVSQSPLAGY